MDVSTTFGRDAEWDGMRALVVIDFLNRFVEAGNHNEMSEGRALYFLLEVTEGDLKRELYTIMPSQKGGRSGEVSSYMELVNRLLRKYADTQSVADLLNIWILGPVAPLTGQSSCGGLN